MKHHNEALQVKAGDSRVLKVGKFIRRSSMMNYLNLLMS